MTDQQFTTAVTGCEEAARSHGHTLGAWHPVSKRLHASLCVVCSALVWVMRSANEKRCLSGGSALRQDCLEDG
jgi:hypothetical protein